MAESRSVPRLQAGRSAGRPDEWPPLALALQDLGHEVTMGVDGSVDFSRTTPCFSGTTRRWFPLLRRQLLVVDPAPSDR